MRKTIQFRTKTIEKNNRQPTEFKIQSSKMQIKPMNFDSFGKPDGSQTGSIERSGRSDKKILQ